MNYSKEQIDHKRHKIASKLGRLEQKGVTILYLLLALASLAAIVCLTCGLYGIYCGILDSAPDIKDINATPAGYLSTVLDTDDKPTATLVAAGSNRIYVTLDEIPLSVQNAFIAIEDRRFRQHNGIDAQGILRAAVIGLTSGDLSQGASTITQQLLKNNVFTDWTDKTSTYEKLKRKLQEQYLAVQLEEVKSKDWILENYLNTVNLGQNTLGVQSASKRYFNKEVSELTLSEAAVIAGITKNPAAYNPITQPEANAERRAIVLKYMVSQGMISPEEEDAALADDVYSRIKSVNAQLTEDTASQVTSYFVDAVTQEVMDDLIQKKGYTQAEAYKALYNGGLTIYSTQDSKLQTICEEEVNNPDNYPGPTKTSVAYTLTVQKADGSFKYYDDQTMLSYNRSKDPDYSMNFTSQADALAAIEDYKEDILATGDTIPENGETFSFTVQPQTALTLIDPSTGQIRALVGGRGKKPGDRTFDRAIDSLRQPGSTFKILAAYAPALDTNQMTLASVKKDKPYIFSDGTPLKNYDNIFRGPITMREAIACSNNVAAVKCLKEIGIDTAFDYLVNHFGFSSLTGQDRYESLVLGGISRGVSNLELTAAYAAIANGGTYIRPHLYTKVLDHEGNLLLENPEAKNEALKGTTAWLLTSAMEDVLTKGTGTAAYFEGINLAGKTGTTNSNKDSLFAGFSPYYACVVWNGYDDNSPQEDEQTASSKLIWKAAMSRIHEGLKAKDFPKPEGIVSADICRKSGKLAIPGLCDEDPQGDMIVQEYFADGTQPTDPCNIHVAASAPYKKNPDHTSDEDRLPETTNDENPTDQSNNESAALENPDEKPNDETTVPEDSNENAENIQADQTSESQ